MATNLTHCPHCGHEMPAEDVSAIPAICPVCGLSVTEETEPSESAVAAESTQEQPSDPLESTLLQAKEALQSQEYTLFLDAAKAALDIDKGCPDALFYQGIAQAFLTQEPDTVRIRLALDKAEAAMEANEFTPDQIAAHIFHWLEIIESYLAAKQQELIRYVNNADVVLQDIRILQEDLASLLELCINAAGYLNPSMAEQYPDTEKVLIALIERGESLVAALKRSYPYYDPKSDSVQKSLLTSSVRSICSACSAQLSSLRRSLPSAAAQQEEIRQIQAASRQSTQAFWDAHPQEQQFLQQYIKQCQTRRTLLIIASILLFAGIVLLWGIGLRSIVSAGTTQFLYSLSIFGLMVVMLTYWILYSLLYKKLDYKNNASIAKRYLSSPSGKEKAIRLFIQDKQSEPDHAAAEHRRKIVRRVVTISISVALIIMLVCSALFYWILPAIYLNKAEKAIAEGDSLTAISYLNHAGSYGHAEQLMEEQLLPFREKALSYDSRVGAYNNILAILDAYGDIYYTDFSSGSYPDVAITNAESLILTQHFIIGLRSDGFISYAQYTTNAGVATPDIASWSDIVRLAKMNNVIVGYQEDGTLVYNSQELPAETLARLHGDNIAGIYDKFGEIAIRTDGSAALPPAQNYSYSDRVQEAFDKIAGWDDLVMVKGDVTNHLVALDKYGRVYAVSGWFDASHNELDVSSWRNIVDIAAGESHTVGLRADGTVVATGSNSYGQCNVSEWTNIVAIEAGSSFTMGIAADGSVYLTTPEDPLYIARGMKNLCLTEEEQAALDALNAPADEESLNEDSTEVSDSEYISSENISSEISEE